MYPDLTQFLGPMRVCPTKWHLSWFSCFCRGLIYVTHTQTDRQTDTETTHQYRLHLALVAVLAMRAYNPTANKQTQAEGSRLEHWCSRHSWHVTCWSHRDFARPSTKRWHSSHTEHCTARRRSLRLLVHHRLHSTSHHINQLLTQTRQFTAILNVNLSYLAAHQNPCVAWSCNG